MIGTHKQGSLRDGSNPRDLIAQKWKTEYFTKYFQYYTHN